MGSIYVICSRQCPDGDGIYTLLYALYKYPTSITNQPTNQRQIRHIDYVARKINNSTNKYQRNRFIPNDLAKEIILGKSRYPPQIRSLTDRHYDRDWAHIGRVVDGAAWDLGPLLDILKPEVLGARIRATQWP